MPRKAIALFSGGLDSSLAVCLMKEQGIEVIAFHLVSLFCKSTLEGQAHPDIIAAAEELGVSLHCEDSTQDMIRMLYHPKWGFGKNRNPCIDCRLNIIKRAEQYRRKIGADFLVSGEVLGQRPMSQNRRSMGIIDENSELRPLLLRPLSARFLEPTIPELEGWVEREKLPEVRGRGRKMQIEMAEQFGITRFSSPAGGCLLTDRNFCHRLNDLMTHMAMIAPPDVRLLRIGRHIRLTPNLKAITGRDHLENDALEAAARNCDLLFQTLENRGSLILLCPDKNTAEDAEFLNLLDAPGELSLANNFAWKQAAGLAVHYSRNRQSGKADVEVRRPGIPWGSGKCLREVTTVDPQTLTVL
ncbi:MAG: hypothetical protein JXA52_01600 [Planctomycetes bacterium]|nr:hypothetical protein [Planctomycetota bacterium]